MDEATDVGPAGVRFKEDFDEFLDQVPTEALDERYVYPESPAKMLDYDMQEWARTRGRAAQPWGLVPDRLGRRCLSSRGGNWLPKSKWNWRAGEKGKPEATNKKGAGGTRVVPPGCQR